MEEVFAFVADAGNDGHWRTEVVRSDLIAGGTGRPGARHRQVMRQGKRESESTHETVEIEPGRKVHWKTPDDERPLTFSGYWGM